MFWQLLHCLVDKSFNLIDRPILCNCCTLQWDINQYFFQSLEGLADLEEGFSEENLQMIVSMDGKDLETALAASKTTIL